MSDLRVAVLVIVVTGTVARAQPPDLSSFHGTKPASLGSIFGKLTLGQVAKPKLPPAEDLGPDIAIELEMNGKRVDALVINISDTVREQPLCAPLLDQLTKAWGPPIREVWQAKSHDRAASFVTGDPPSCSLRFYRMVPAKQWLNTSRQSVVPIWAIGKPAAQLEAALAPLQPEPQEDSDTHARSIRWQDTSIDGEHVDLTAYYRRGKVTGIEVGMLVGDAVLEAWQRLNAMFGAPDRLHASDEERRWKWRAAPGIQLLNATAVPASPSVRRPLLPGERERVPAVPKAKPPKQPEGTYTSIVFGVKP